MEEQRTENRISSAERPERPLLQVEKLRLCFNGPEGVVHAVMDADLTVHAGEIAALVGASGSGKTALCRAVLRLHASHARYESGHIWLQGQDVLNLSEKEMQKLRGTAAAMVFQDPLSALDPVRTIGEQITAPMIFHGNAGGHPDQNAGGYSSAEERRREGSFSRHALRAVARTELEDRAAALLSEMGLEDPRAKMKQYPHELSGGQRQRAAMAVALACDPDLLIADEPTTALDPWTRKKIMELLRRTAKEQGRGVLFITHDLGLARGLADRTYVMDQGRIIESGPTEEIFRCPREEYTKRLVRYADYGKPTSHFHGAAGTGWLVRASHIDLSYPGRGGAPRPVLRDFSITVKKGELLGLVGPSGCGKSTLAKLLMGILWPDSGEIRWSGPCRRQLIFQDSAAAFDERMTLEQIIGEPLAVSAGLRGFSSAARRQRRKRVREVIEKVYLEPELLDRHPYDVSGGQRQRAAIARALITEPDFLIADEPVSSLDVPVQAEIVHLLRELCSRERLTMILISHDLPMTEHVSDRILEMPAPPAPER